MNRLTAKNMHNLLVVYGGQSYICLYIFGYEILICVCYYVVPPMAFQAEGDSTSNSAPQASGSAPRASFSSAEPHPPIEGQVRLHQFCL